MSTELENETKDDKIARLEARIERLKRNMLSTDTRPRIIAGAVSMSEARRNRIFAEMFLAACDRGKEREVDKKSIAEFVIELEDKWGLHDRPSLSGSENGGAFGPENEPEADRERPGGNMSGNV